MDDDALDRDVRTALEPEPDAVGRVVRDAMGRPRPRRFWAGGVLVAAGAAVILVAGAFVMNRHAIPAGRPPIHVTNVGDTIVVTEAEGGVWLIGGGPVPDAGLQSGTMIVFGSGDRR